LRTRDFNTGLSSGGCNAPTAFALRRGKAISVARCASWPTIRSISDPRIDPAELVSHSLCPRAMIRLVKHGAHGFRANAWGVGSLVARLMPAPDHATRGVHVGLVFGQSCGDKRNSKAQRPD